MMETSHRGVMSDSEFFAWQETKDERYELIDGVAVLRGEWVRYGDQWTKTSGASQQHDQIVVNLLAALRSRLRGRPERVFSSALCVRISAGRIRRPDAGIDCGPRVDRSTVASEPKVVIEVLSPSTRDFDIFGKLDEYRGVDSIDHVLLVDPNDPQASLWSRRPDGWTDANLRGIEAVAEFDSVGVTLPLAEIYLDVAFLGRPEDAAPLMR